MVSDIVQKFSIEYYSQGNVNEDIVILTKIVKSSPNNQKLFEVKTKM